MKKLFTLAIIACVFVFNQSSAQIQKGETMLGASLSFETTRLEEDPAAGGIGNDVKSRIVEIVPELGVGLGGNWVIGIGAGYAYAKLHNESAWSQNQVHKGFTGMAFVRKFYPVAGKFGIFGQGNLAYQALTSEAASASKSKINSLGLALRPGVYVRATKRFIVEAYLGNIGYTHSTSKPAEGDAWKATANSFNVGLTNELSLAFKVVL